MSAWIWFSKKIEALTGNLRLIQIKKGRLPRIRHCSLHDLDPRRRLVRLGLAGGQDVLDLDAVRQQVVTEQLPVAVPVIALGRT